MRRTRSDSQLFVRPRVKHAATVHVSCSCDSTIARCGNFRGGRYDASACGDVENTARAKRNVKQHPCVRYPPPPRAPLPVPQARLHNDAFEEELELLKKYVMPVQRRRGANVVVWRKGEAKLPPLPKTPSRMARTVIQGACLHPLPAFVQVAGDFAFAHSVFCVPV